MNSDNRYRLIVPHLESILRWTKRVGGFRVWIVSFIFPEFLEILGDLESIGDIVDKNKAP